MAARQGQSATDPYVFVCYSHDDEARVYPLIEFLQADGVALWFDRGIRAGTVWRSGIAEALDRATHVLFYVSRASLASAHCDREVQYALDHDKTIIPVFLDDVDLTPSLRVALGRVQALYVSKVPAEALRRTLRDAIRGVDVQTVATLRSEPPTRRLRRVVGIGGALIVAAAVAAGAWWFARTHGAPALPTPSIAVLPFTAMSDEAEVRHLAEGIVDEITSDLSAHRQFTVAARPAVAALGGKNVTALASSLGVSYVLVGGVRAFGDGYRATAQLVRASDATQQWSQTFDFGRSAGEMEDAARLIVLYVQNRIGIDVELAWERTQTTNDEAFAYYAQAVRSFSDLLTGGANNDPDWTAHGLANVDRAIELDANFAPAYLYRTLILSNGNPGRLDREQLARESRRAIDRFIELRPDDPGGYVLRGMIQMQFELDLAGSEQSLLEARRREPNLASEYEQQAHLAMLRGDEIGAISNFKHSFELDAAVAGDHVLYGWMLVNQRDFAEAEREFDTAVKLLPNGSERVGPMVGRIIAASLQGHDDEAKAHFDAAWSMFGHTMPEVFVLALPRLGREQELRDLMKEWDEGSRPTSPSVRFVAHYALGEYDEAMKWMLRAVDERDFNVRLFARLPNAYPDIRRHPALPAVLARLDAVEVSH